MKAMILAAGEGTRLRPLTHHTPKALLPVGDAPLLVQMLSWLKYYGITEIAINLHHLGEQVRAALGDGTKYGVRVTYSHEPSLLGTAGGVKKLAPFFDGTFIVVYGDVLTDLNLDSMLEFHHGHRSQATLAVTVVDNPWEKGVVVLDNNGRITRLVEKPARGQEPSRLANGGVYILERQVLDSVPSNIFYDFASDLFPRLIALGFPMYGYVPDPGSYLQDIGTPEQYQKAQQEVQLGLVHTYHGRGGRRAVFLDRDGTMARDVPYCSRVEDFELLPTVCQAVKLLNDAGFLVVVVTNQSGVARGYFTEETLGQIHQRLRDELARHKARVDAIYYCPHHPDQGCLCRKPGTRLFRQAAEQYGIDFGASYVVGDTDQDSMAGQSLGCRTVLVSTGPKGLQGIAARPTFVAGNLLEAAQWILHDGGRAPGNPRAGPSPDLL